MQHKILYSCLVQGGSSFEILKEWFALQSQFLDIQNISPIYELKQNEEDIDSNRVQAHSLMGNCLAASFSALYDHGPEDFQQEMQKLLNKLSSEKPHCSLKFLLLLFENQSQMKPSLTLPNPFLHLRSELIVPSSELWPSFEHPVLKLSLAQLRNQTTARGNLEFYAQGNSLRA